MLRNWSVRRGGAATTVATPQFSPAAGGYGPTTDVTITCATVGATIYYTTDGSDPDATDTEYTVPISVAATTTIKAIAIDGVLIDSAIASATYTITGTSSALLLESGDHLLLESGDRILLEA